MASPWRYGIIRLMDILMKTMSSNGHFRAFVLDSTETVRTAQEKHDTMASSTVALGRALIANLMLAANEKGNTKMTLKILGDGAMGAIISVANTKGQVKGYLQNPDLDYKRTSTGDVIVGPLVGQGQFLVITDYGTRQPYHSMTPLISGEIGEDFAFFLTDSQQTPSAVGLNVLLNEEDQVTVAGGFLLQVLPGATEEEIARFEKRVQDMPAISHLLQQDQPTQAILDALYGEDDYNVLSQEPLAFACDCSKDRFLDALASLPVQDLTEMKDEDKGADITCQFCQTHYHFTEDNLEELIRDKS